jgi:integrase
VRECYVDDEDFGALVDVLSQTGTRESQARKVWPDDLRDDDPEQTRLMLWCSNKGKDREPEQRSVAISPRLAKILRGRAIKNGNRQLFDAARIRYFSERFRKVLTRLGLDTTLTPYVLRHSSIIRQIRAGTPLRMIAFVHDTSVVEIERTYARYLNDASHDLIRKGLLADLDEVPAANVVQLKR